GPIVPYSACQHFSFLAFVFSLPSPISRPLGGRRGDRLKTVPPTADPSQSASPPPENKMATSTLDHRLPAAIKPPDICFGGVGTSLVPNRPRNVNESIPYLSITQLQPIVPRRQIDHRPLRLKPTRLLSPFRDLLGLRSDLHARPSWC